jgi:hypothetical protein
MSNEDKRESSRIPLQATVTEHLHDYSQQSLLLNIGTTGLFVNRLNSPHVQAFDAAPRRSIVGLEFELPDVSETIWASGEVRHGQHDALFSGSGVRFVSIAKAHRQLIDDYVRDYRIQRLREILARVRRNRPV